MLGWRGSGTTTRRALSRSYTSVIASSERPSSPKNVKRRDTVLAGMACPCCIATEARTGWYSRLFAYVLANGMDRYEVAIAPVKNQLFPQLLAGLEQPVILDMGVGAGPNLKYYPPSSKVVGMDPNPAMEAYSVEKAAAAGLHGGFSFVVGDAQQMPFEPASFDAAVVTLVLCSVPDVQATLKELQRVVRPGGRVLFVEHVLSPQPDLLRVGQQVLNPLQQLVADGCHLTRDTGAALQQAGFKGVEGLMRFEVEGLWILAPHVAGVLEV